MTFHIAYLRELGLENSPKKEEGRKERKKGKSPTSPFPLLPCF
jgi:hypothetical protein